MTEFTKDRFELLYCSTEKRKERCEVQQQLGFLLLIIYLVSESSSEVLSVAESVDVSEVAARQLRREAKSTKLRRTSPSLILCSYSAFLMNEKSSFFLVSGFFPLSIFSFFLKRFSSLKRQISRFDESEHLSRFN